MFTFRCKIIPVLLAKLVSLSNKSYKKLFNSTLAF